MAAPARPAFNALQQPEDLSDPRFKPVIAGVLFTKWFIVTYQGAILAMLLIFTAINYLSGLKDSSNLTGKRLNKRTGPVNVENTALCCGSHRPLSLLGKPRFKQIGDERTSLLAESYKPSFTAMFFRWLMAFVIYQPPSIPIINKPLPSNKTSFLVLAFIGLNAFYALFRCLPKGVMLFVFADRAGALFAANLPLLYLLAAKNQPITWLTGYSYEQLNILHRRQGELLCSLALIHCTSMMVVWYEVLRPKFSLLDFLTEKVILSGIGAFFAFSLLYFTSLSSFRQRNYEGFLILHVLSQLAALSLLFFHHPRSRVYVGLAFGVFVTDRVFYRLALKAQKMRVNLTILEDQSTVLVSANWQIPAAGRFIRNVKNGWGPTEHVFISVPALSRKHVIQSHPFTIASAAPTDQNSHAWLNLIVRAQDGFSQDLLNYAKIHSSVNAYLDGPYGNQRAFDMLSKCDIAITIAGGSGIAVTYPLAWALATREKDIKCISSNDEELLSISLWEKKIHLVWIVRERSHFSWIGDARLKELENFGVHVHLPPPTIESGRPNVASYVNRLAQSDNIEFWNKKVGIVCSGPDSMNRESRNSVAALVKRGMDVNIKIEKFEW